MGPLSDSVPTVGVVPEVTIIVGIIVVGEGVSLPSPDSVGDGVSLPTPDSVGDGVMQMSTTLQIMIFSNVAEQHSSEVSKISDLSTVSDPLVHLVLLLILSEYHFRPSHGIGAGVVIVLNGAGVGSEVTGDGVVIVSTGEGVGFSVVGSEVTGDAVGASVGLQMSSLSHLTLALIKPPSTSSEQQSSKLLKTSSLSTDS